MFDHGSVSKPLNYEMPGHVPNRPMGDHLVIARLVWPDGEEWRPVRANRWTRTHVMIEWDDHIAWLRAEDVTRALRRDSA